MALVGSSVAVTGAGAESAQQLSGAPAGDDGKIKPALAEALAEKGEASFWIRFAARADLSAARGIADWGERGIAVYEQLTQTANRSQKDVVRELRRRDVSHQAFWATNAIRVDAGSERLALQLAARPEVEALYPTREYTLVKPTPGDDAMEVDAVEWGIANINADDVWAQIGVTGEGITVANIDTGVQFDHPALVGKYRGNDGGGSFDHNYNWFDAAGSCADAPCDGDGHGSHTMGTIIGDDGGSNQIGAAPGAKWIAANGCCPSDAALIASGEWMLAPEDLNGENPDPTKRPHIVNNSWGTQVPSNDPFMEDVLEDWAAAGIFGTWSNGNNGPDCATSGSPGSRILNYSVGAYDINNNIASFSSRGAGQDGEIKPNIAAPGVNVRSSLPGNGYGNFNGTSMAAPHLAGSIALLWSAAPAMVGDIEGTRALLDDTATDHEDLQCGGTADDNNVFGEGRLDALALVNAAPVGETATLEGTITDAATGDPLGGATVTITGPIEREVTTADDGTYSVRLTAGDYTVAAAAFGYATETANVTLPAGETVTQDFALDAVPTVVVNGTVLDGSGHGWPLYTKVSVEGTSLHTYTNPSTGRYRISLPSQATYMLRFETQYPGYEVVTEEVEVGSTNERVNVDVPVDANTCIAPGYQHNFDGIGESFDGGVLPAGWTIVDNVGNGQVWRFDDPGERGNLTGGDGPFAIMDSDFYGSSGEQDTSLVTPVIDLSTQSSPVVGFRQDYNNLGDFADVDVSVDGGATWETALHQTTDVRGPNEQFIPLPQAANEPDVQIRFHNYEADFDWWWEVDDVFVGNRTCDPFNGGLLVGHVRDRNTDNPVNGATVTSVDAPQDTATTRATPDDPALADGWYWLFSSLTGDHRFRATATNYGRQTRFVDVEPDWTTPVNFRLRAGRLAVEPTELEATMQLGDSTAERQFTVTNTGERPVNVEFSERGGDFVLLRADGTRMTSDEIAAASGAPPQRIEADVSYASTVGRTGTTGNDVRSTSPSEAPWTDIADYPASVMDNRVVNLDCKVYSVAGGTGSASTADVFVYDPATLAWSPVADLPEPRNGLAVGSVDGKIIATGGWGDAGPSTSTWVYDPDADSWTAAAAAPLARSAAGAAVADGKLYIIGGCTTDGCTPMADNVMAYDLASDSWEIQPDYPLAVAFPSCGGRSKVSPTARAAPRNRRRRPTATRSSREPHRGRSSPTLPLTVGPARTPSPTGS